MSARAMVTPTPSYDPYLRYVPAEAIHATSTEYPETLSVVEHFDGDVAHFDIAPLGFVHQSGSSAAKKVPRNSTGTPVTRPARC